MKMKTKILIISFTIIIVLGFLLYFIGKAKNIESTQDIFQPEFNHVNNVSEILDNPGNNTDLIERKRKIENDELEYGNNYQKMDLFVLYTEKPDRIVYKQGNKNGFYIFEKNDKAYEHLLIVSEDRMKYSTMEDYNLWSFTPDSIDTMEKSGENYIIYDFDNIGLKENDINFQKDIIFRFNSNNRLYRLVSYLAEFKSATPRESLNKTEFATNTSVSGYKYIMNPNLED